MSSVFNKLDSIDVSKNTEKKGMFTYLSWAWAVRELLRVSPTATWRICDYDYQREGGGYERQPYMQTPAGAFVKVILTVDGIDREQVHPVLDHKNKTVEQPNAFQINTSIQRCLAKAIALHGLGLYIYAGEDLPSEPDSLTKEQYETLMGYVKEIGDKNLETQIVSKIGTNEINDSNYKGGLAKLKRLADKKKPKKVKAKA